MLLRLLLLICASLCERIELFLKPSPSSPIEGNSMTLTCEFQRPPQASDIQFQFCFFRDGETLGSAWNSVPELQLLPMWTEDSGFYWCEAKTVKTRITRSRMIQINVQRVPVSDVSLEAQPSGGQVVEGKKLVFVCSVAKGTGNITFIWYKGTIGLKLGTKTQRSSTAEFEILMARESDTEQYYCAAENGYGPRISGLVSITVRIPVSHPVLILRTTGAQAMVGDMVELHCETPKGSPPILYQFYHKDVILESSWASLRGGVSFNLSLTIEHSGNYFCKASNDLGMKRSEIVSLNITVPTENRMELLTSGVIKGLLGILVPSTMVLLFCYWLKRKTGRRSARDPLRSPPSPLPQEAMYLNSSTSVPPHSMYENVNVVSGDDVYSLVYSTQQEQKSTAGETWGVNLCLTLSIIETLKNQRLCIAELLLLLLELTMSIADSWCGTVSIYSKLKKAPVTDVDYENDM
ncbi:PREDICTED: Fc receptor-like protein 1 [Chrysochloris asiatica]|uniref:Fc receptor-like protein 1 n=1 Tax=Chrysochloris asiatica TaxID=185453 RepID=A0A9B0TB63_CHRAS|nr:PREDICTED: Fc receptor-like protein 1 [Chrysochloris asiatica]